MLTLKHLAKTYPKNEIKIIMKNFFVFENQTKNTMTILTYFCKLLDKTFEKCE